MDDLPPYNLDNDIKLPNAGSGYEEFTANVKGTTYNGFVGYGDLYTSTIRGCDEWLKTVLQQEDVIPVECIGRFERFGDSISPVNISNTDSEHAHAWHSGTTYNAQVKAYWEITTTIQSGVKYKVLNVRLVLSQDSDFSARDYETKIDSYDLEITMSAAIGQSSISLYTVKFDGKTVVENQSNFYSALSAIEQKITDIKDSVDGGLSGYKEYLRTKISGSGCDKIFYSNDKINFSPNDFTFNNNTAEANVTIYSKYTTQPQIYISGAYKAKQPLYVTLYINKSVKDESDFSNNYFYLPEYDLRGTTFTLYETSGSKIKDIHGNNATVTVTSRTGTSDMILELPYTYAGKTVEIREELPPEATGYKTGERRQITLPDVETKHKQYDFENEPVLCPVRLIVNKQSALTKGVPIADIDFSGIEYTLVYYGNQSYSNSNAHSNSGAVNTWKFTTKELNDLGYIDFQNGSYKSGGDSLYYYNDEIRYPLGWYRLYESSSVNSMQDKGLEVNSEPFYMHAYLDPTTNDRIIDYWQSSTQLTSEHYPKNDTLTHDHETTIDEQEHWERFGFVKTDILLNSEGPEGDTEFEGAVFTVYSEDSNRFKGSQTYDGHTYSIGSGNVVLVDGSPLTITIDRNGKGICEYPLPKTDNTYL